MRALFAFTLLSLPAFANENIRPARELLAQGYQRVEPSPRAASTLPAPHAFPWPVAFQDSAHTIGNSMVEYQPFSDPAYYHGGCDLRTSADADIHAPVSGRLEAGHYGYDTNRDGSMVKFWKPWPQEGDDTYFEIAVVADDGTRFELHHVNRDHLPPAIVAKLNAGGARVAAGELLGHVIYWPGGYHHTHYNIVLPSGVRVNPEFASPLLTDTRAPEILGLFALQGETVVDFGNGQFTDAPSEFVVDVVDHQDGNVYDHPPVYARLHFAAGPETVWDFRTTLTGANGAFPPLWDFLRPYLGTPSGTRETEGGYGTGHSLVRLVVPAGARGPFTIELADIAGNTAVKSGAIAP